jgi:hypothetical protein
MTEEFVGTVRRKVVAAGSKSERDAVVLVTASGELVLRRLGGNPFADPELDALVGATIRCTGELRGSTLIVSSWTDAPA